MGMLTILIWSANSYLFRQFTSNFGTFFGTGISYVTGGIVGAVVYCFTQNEFTQINKTSCCVSSLFITNMIFCALSFSLPPTGDVLLQCLIINYFWVVLSNIFLVYILGYKITSKLGFYFGIICATLGIIVACVGFDFKHINFVKYFPKYYYCYCFAIISAVSWAYYTTYLKKYTLEIKDDHVSISLIITGVICIIISICIGEHKNYFDIKLDFKNVGIYLYQSLIVFYIAYHLWSISSKYGDIKILVNFCLLAPALSVIFTSSFYGINLFGNVVYGSIILVFAIVCCKYSMCEATEIHVLNMSKEEPVYVENC